MERMASRWKNTLQYALIAVCAVLSTTAALARGARFVEIVADDSSIDAKGNLIDGAGLVHRAVYKPAVTSLPGWVHLPAITTAESHGHRTSIRMEIDGTGEQMPPGPDKVNLNVVHGSAPYAPRFGDTKFLSFAIKLGKFDAQQPTIPMQWWQGTPYGPPLSIVAEGTDSYKVLVRNDVTKGNPSAVPVTAGAGTFASGWNTFVVETVFDFAGDNGVVIVWQNGNEVVSWKGRVGYDPKADPYVSPTGHHPNTGIDIHMGPYGGRQTATRQVYYDDIRFGDSYADVAPASQPLPKE